MAWLPQYPQGQDPGDLAALYHFQVHDIPANLTHYRGNDWANAVAQIAPEVKNFIRQKQSDDIANQLMQENGMGGQGGADELKMRLAFNAAQAKQNEQNAQAKHYQNEAIRSSAIGGGGGSSSPRVDPAADQRFLAGLGVVGNG